MELIIPLKYQFSNQQNILGPVLVECSSPLLRSTLWVGRGTLGGGTGSIHDVPATPSARLVGPVSTVRELSRHLPNQPDGQSHLR